MLLVRPLHYSISSYDSKYWTRGGSEWLDPNTVDPNDPDTICERGVFHSDCIIEMRYRRRRSSDVTPTYEPFPKSPGGTPITPRFKKPDGSDAWELVKKYGCCRPYRAPEKEEELSDFKTPNEDQIFEDALEPFFLEDQEIFEKDQTEKDRKVSPRRLKEKELGVFFQELQETYKVKERPRGCGCEGCMNAAKGFPCNDDPTNDVRLEDWIELSMSFPDSKIRKNIEDLHREDQIKILRFENLVKASREKLDKIAEKFNKWEEWSTSESEVDGKILRYKPEKESTEKKLFADRLTEHANSHLKEGMPSSSSTKKVFEDTRPMPDEYYKASFFFTKVWPVSHLGKTPTHPLKV